MEVILGPDRPKMSQDGPRCSQEGSKIHMDGPKKRQNGSKMVQDGSKIVPDASKISSSSQMGGAPKLSTKQEPTTIDTNTQVDDRKHVGEA